METQNRLDLFEPGDLTALVCVDVPEVQRIVIEQLTSLGYKIHTGLFVEDVLLKLRTHVYDVVFVSEHFNAGNIETNQIVAEAVKVPAEQRRRQFFAVVGASFVTNDEMQAFEHSVDLVVALTDVVNLRPVLRRGLRRTQEFYAPMKDALKTAEAA
jgi:CheY-like chemotaxis protein